MLKAPWVKMIAFALCLAFVSSPGFAQDKKKAKKENTKTSAKKAPAKDEKPLTLEEKYPISTTPQTATNQNASTYMQEGLRLYAQTRKIFEAVNEIKSTFDDANYLLEIEQKGIIQARLTPQDLMKYGPEYAYIGLRVRGLQEAEAVISKAIAQFAQARQLAPTISVIPRWQRIAEDTRKAIRFHIAYYREATKGIERGATQFELDLLTYVWEMPKQGPQDVLTQRIYTVPFQAARGDFNKAENKKEKDSLDILSPAQRLPDMDFKSSGK
ncbi:MAG: hypothetical protein IGS03_15085 [Candidatus Sericytochromatia bacterium]|nr:hypothetical protein [Candidatus Sericytochromatia bacterium]